MKHHFLPDREDGKLVHSSMVYEEEQQRQVQYSSHHNGYRPERAVCVSEEDSHLTRNLNMAEKEIAGLAADKRKQKLEAEIADTYKRDMITRVTHHREMQAKVKFVHSKKVSYLME